MQSTKANFRFRPSEPVRYRTHLHDPEMGGQEPTPLLVAGLFSLWVDERRQLSERMVAKHSPAFLGAMPATWRRCRDMVCIADKFQGVTPRGRYVPELMPEDRRRTLAFLFAVRFDKTLAEGERAVEAARNVGWEELFTVLALEAGNATLSCAAFGAAGATGFYGASFLASAAANAWKAGGLVGAGKAAAFSVGASTVALGAVGVMAGVAENAFRVYVSLEEERQDLEEQQWGRDAIFCELITNRRYLRHPTPKW